MQIPQHTNKGLIGQTPNRSYASKELNIVKLCLLDAALPWLVAKGVSSQTDAPLGTPATYHSAPANKAPR